MAEMPKAINYTLLQSEELEELQQRAQQVEELTRRVQALEQWRERCVMGFQVQCSDPAQIHALPLWDLLGMAQDVKRREAVLDEIRGRIYNAAIEGQDKSRVALRILEAGHIDPSSSSGLARLADILREARRSATDARYPIRSCLLDLEHACRTEMRRLEDTQNRQCESSEI